MLFFRLECSRNPFRLDTPSHQTTTAVNKGAYSGSGRISDICALHENSQHPIPSQDGFYVPNSEYVFGFQSMEQLNAWFDDEEGRERVRAEGIAQIGVYESDDFIHGGKQSIFNCLSCTRVDTLSPDTMFY